MTKSINNNPGYKKFIMFLLGLFVLILGITMILVFWKDVVVLFRGSFGLIAALAGLLLLYSANDKSGK